MRLLVVHAHPLTDSYGGSLRDAAMAALRQSGHETLLIDLYAQRFDPVLDAESRARYYHDPRANADAVRAHVDALRWAEGWVAVYPTWYYGPPAILKGWLDRVWLPGVAFTIGGAPPHRRIEGTLRNIRLFVGITTSGSPWWWLKVIGDPGRSLFMKGLKPMYARGCRMRWLQLHDMDNATTTRRQAFLDRVQRELGASTLR